MDCKLSKNATGDDSPHWPTAPIFAYGTLGGPVGRRFHFRSGLALAALVVCILLSVLLRPFVPKNGLKLIVALAPGVAFAYIAWEFRKYLAALDELARRIQLESIAWTYLCGVALAMLFGGLAMVYGWSFNPVCFILLEPVRAGWLYFVSRRYQ